MEIVAIVTVLALAEYMWLVTRVGRARVQYEVKAPATTGNPIFERHYRIQINTIEQLVVFLPALWLFGLYVNALVAGLLGLVFVAGRALYAVRYAQDPEKRGPGALVTFAANLVLVAGALIGSVMAYFGR
jgi:glutathione S-transferase